MKVATIVLLAVALTLCYCWTADGLKNAVAGIFARWHRRRSSRVFHARSICGGLRWYLDGAVARIGLRNDKTRLRKTNHQRGHHLGNMASNLDERRSVECKCVPRNPHELQRKRRHMNKPLKRHPQGRRCHCKKRRNSELSIPLS